jgi:hypothetical protein
MSPRDRATSSSKHAARPRSENGPGGGVATEGQPDLAELIVDAAVRALGANRKHSDTLVREVLEAVVLQAFARDPRLVFEGAMWEVAEMRDARHAAAMRQTVESVDEEPAEFRPAPRRAHLRREALDRGKTEPPMAGSHSRWKATRTLAIRPSARPGPAGGRSGDREPFEREIRDADREFAELNRKAARKRPGRQRTSPRSRAGMGAPRGARPLTGGAARLEEMAAGRNRRRADCTRRMLAPR